MHSFSKYRNLFNFHYHIKNEQFIDHNSLKNEEQRIISVFNKLLEVQPTLQLLCKLCSMSRSSLHRSCINYFNMPPHKAFIHFKMSHVAEFIRKNPQISIKELSETFGFKNQFHFSRVFKKELGYCPSLLYSKYVDWKKVLSVPKKTLLFRLESP